MVKNAVGLLEVVGLAAAVEAADAAVKAANIELLGYELTKGGGMVVVKLSGDVGAVKAAVDAGAMAAARINRVVATHVIPRPHHELDAMIATTETVGRSNHTTAVPVPVSIPEPPVIIEVPVSLVEEPAGDDQPDKAQDNNQDSKKWGYTCNLCGDPACQRRKGESKMTCLHYDKNNKEDE
jgi:microcompartment protein CcmL/EutN